MALFGVFGGGTFWGPRGTPPSKGGGSRIPDFKDPFSGPPLGVPVFGPSQKQPLLKKGALSESESKIEAALLDVCLKLGVYL